MSKLKKNVATNTRPKAMVNLTGYKSPRVCQCSRAARSTIQLKENIALPAKCTVPATNQRDGAKGNRRAIHHAGMESNANTYQYPSARFTANPHGTGSPIIERDK